MKLSKFATLAKIKINIKDGSIKKNDIVLGIDLGTSNSLIAFAKKNAAYPVCLGEIGDVLTPSIVYFKEDGSFLCGKEARDKLTDDPENTVYSVKRLLGRSYTDLKNHAGSYSYKLVPDETKAMVNIEIRSKIYNPVEISSLILKSLKEKAEKILGESVSKAVITVPAYFNDSQRQATRDAGKLAGWEVLRILNEPTAASLAYGIGLSEHESKKVAVYDLGGGTFDITILNIENGVFEVLSANGDTYTGGDDFDRSIVEHWIQKYDFNFAATEADKSLYQKLRKAAEKAKIELSISNNSSGSIIHNSEEYVLELSREVLQKLMDPVIEITLKSCSMALKDSGLTIDDIEEVIMVGGSTRSPYVCLKVQDFFKKEKLNNSLNPDEIVAMGAAIEADILAGNRKDILLLDVTPLSLGIETIGGLMDVILPRNTKIPARVARQYTTSKDAQSKLKISVYQGERELVEDNRKLGEFILENIPAMPAGLPKIEIRFTLDADGILSVEAEELRSQVKQTIVIKPQYGLTDKELENMLLSAMTNAEADMNKRIIGEMKVEAEQIIYQCQKMMQKNKHLILEDEKEQIQNTMNELESNLKGSDKDAINKTMERLNRISRPFAERIMDLAVGNALKGKKVNEI